MRIFFKRLLTIGGSGIALQGATILCEENNSKKDFAKFGNFNPEKINIEELGKSFYELIEYGSPGKIGYGFMMGYSSGFCLKKVVV